jgi:hypothetical protein
MSQLPPTSFTHNTERDDEFAVYDGQQLIGFVRARNRMFEALDRGHHAIAVFDTAHAAMRACRNVS